MEAASNAGSAVCDSDYVVIHDDDDSWLPDFLDRTVAFLDSEKGARYGGVATHSVYVSEEIRDDARHRA
jgi:glycosyltransferase involved in cell wall biosynthesis